MMLQEDNKLAFSQKYDVLVVDPGSRIKLARWRLQSDGHRVFYVQDISGLESVAAASGVKVALINIDCERDLDVPRRLQTVSGGLRVVAVMGEKTARLMKDVFAAGVAKTLPRPIHYPRLSDAIKEGLVQAANRIPERSPAGTGKIRSIPLEFSFSCKDVLEYMKPAVLVLDQTGKIRLVNRSMQNLLGIPSENLLNINYKAAGIFSAGYTPLINLLHEAFNSKDVIDWSEMVVNTPDGPMLYEAQVSPVIGRKGHFSGVVLTARDISNPNQLEQVMAQSEKLAIVGQLAAGAVHEIRNPLTSVRGFIQLLQNELEGTPKEEYLNIIINEIDRVNNIVNEFLTLAKPAAPNKKSADLRQLYEEINVLIESEAFLKNIDISLDLVEELPLIYVDCEQIKQVLINVIRNSFEAISEGGKITIRAYEIPDENTVCLEVHDTGPGMDEETVQRIFTPFFTTKDTGTGLGLAVSSEIMACHGGKMEIKSAVGCGTTVYLYLPFAEKV